MTTPTSDPLDGFEVSADDHGDVALYCCTCLWGFDPVGLRSPSLGLLNRKAEEHIAAGHPLAKRRQPLPVTTDPAGSYRPQHDNQ